MTTSKPGRGTDKRRWALLRQTSSILRTCTGLAALLLLALSITACGTTADPTAPPATLPVQGSATEASAEATEVPADLPPDPEAITQSWQGGAHASTFVTTEEGTNSTCARCHSPVNWIPTMDDIPESCLTCKFTVEPPPPLIPENEWADIPCMVCHRVDKKGVVEAEYAWLEIAQIEEYADVDSADALCGKCHGGVDLPGHQAIVVGGVHAEFLCTECHNAHDTLAGCTTGGCHDGLEEASIAGHTGAHQLVSCVACHDASGMEVGPSEQAGQWTTLLPASEAGMGDPGFVSHNIQLAASCDRCHFADNPWDLSESVAVP